MIAGVEVGPVGGDGAVEAGGPTVALGTLVCSLVMPHAPTATATRKSAAVSDDRSRFAARPLR